MEFETALFDGLLQCNNRCPFCFIDQQPPGKRDSLYLKDDDYRLSFLYGSYLTLTNLTEKEWQRIEGKIQKAEIEVVQIGAQLHAPENLNDLAKLQEISDQLVAAEGRVQQLYDRWAELEELFA